MSTQYRQLYEPVPILALLYASVGVCSIILQPLISEFKLLWGVYYLFLLTPGYIILSAFPEPLPQLPRIIVGVCLSLVLLMLSGLKPSPIATIGMTVLPAAVAFPYATDLLPDTRPDIAWPFLWNALLILSGIYLLDATGENILALLGFCLLPLNAIIAYLQNRTETWYATALLFAGLGLSLSWTLRNQHVPMGDISFEWVAIQAYIETGYFAPSQLPTQYTQRLGSLLSVTTYPAAVASILGQSKWVLLFGSRLLAPLLPLGSFAIARQVVSRRNAFFCGFLTISQFAFINMMGASRTLIGFLMFYGIIAITANNTPTRNRRLLVLILVLGSVVSHYTTALYVGAWFFGSYILPSIFSIPRRSQSYFSLSLGLIPGILAFFWYANASNPIITDIVFYGASAVQSLLSPSSAGSVTGGGHTSPIAYYVSFAIFLMTVCITAIGTLRAIVYGVDWDSEFTRMAIVASAGFGASAILLRFYGGYDSIRVFLQFTPLLAPLLVVGAAWISGLSRFISSLPRSTLKHAIVVFVILAQFSAGSYLIYEATGTPHNQLLHNDGQRYDRYHVSGAEVEAVDYISKHATEDAEVWADYYGEPIVAQRLPTQAQQGIGMPGFSEDQISRGDFVFLRCPNTRKGLLDPKYAEKKSVSQLERLESMELVYSSGCAEVYKLE